jgi:hypothetical protein
MICLCWASVGSDQALSSEPPAGLVSKPARGWAAGLGAVACGSTKPALPRGCVAMANGCGWNGTALKDTNNIMQDTRHKGLKSTHAITCALASVITDESCRHWKQKLPVTPCVARATPATLARDTHMRDAPCHCTECMHSHKYNQMSSHLNHMHMGVKSYP